MALTRREFLKTASIGAPATLALGASAPLFLSGLATAADGQQSREDTILVVVQLAGGNDGLNTIVPYGDDNYGRVRRTLRLKSGELHKIDDHLGFHPAMESAWQLYQEGVLGIVQGVGYPNPDESHPRSMRIWQTADRDEGNCRTGWLGRAAERVHPREETGATAVFVGQINQPFTLHAQQAVIPTLHSLEDYTVQNMPGADGGAAQRRRLVETAGLARSSGNPFVEFVRSGDLSAYAHSRQVELVAKAASAAPGGDYPPFQLAASLCTIAQLIRADVGLRIFLAELGGEEPGGFDNHANERDNHASLLRQLSDSLSAFVRDLRRDKLLNRVLLMTYSEFGRTVEENGRRGTDHGSAAPMFLVGGRLKGGLTGGHPSLTELEKNGLKHHTDFRRVYATALDHWLGIDSRAVLGRQFEPLDVLSV
jgi:uncharacterized protein (DUF1501 family)